MIEKRNFGYTLIGLLACVCANTVNAAMVTVTPDAPSVQVGSEFDVEVRISGLGDGMSLSLGNFDINVEFNSSVLTPLAVEFGDAGGINGLDASGLGTLQTSTLGANSVEISEVSFDSPGDLNFSQAGDFALFRISFSADAVGQSQFILGAILGDENGATLSASLSNGAVDVRAVPLPASAILFATGLLFLRRAFARRR